MVASVDGFWHRDLTLTQHSTELQMIAHGFISLSENVRLRVRAPLANPGPFGNAADCAGVAVLPGMPDRTISYPEPKGEQALANGSVVIVPAAPAC